MNDKLIPAFTEAEKQSMMEYYAFYIKHVGSFTEQALEDLKSHPIWGAIISQMTREMIDENNKVSLQLQEDAIVQGKWQPYIQHTTEQGIRYAKMGIDFKEWFDVVSLVRKYLLPTIQKEIRQPAKIIEIINGMDLFMDCGMTIIGESYIQETRKIIEAQKLAALEQKQLTEKELIRIEELERFRKLTVGRELKMIELKKEIEELKTQISGLEKNKK